MKLFFKLIIFATSINIYSRELIIIEDTQNHPDLMTLATEVMVKNFHIPEKFIIKKKMSINCHIKKDSILHICIENNEFKIIKANKFYIEKLAIE